ncbi:mitochondrial protein cyt-4 [Podospora fimiseda]|uniref:Mitochondrial protein cyt-4 n=1 Tax=Podospora fimiseda TaxID=252190 RepID=A0AAN7H3B3_9PEZI|nr:mitochondrial protein cyt-4 [Podospora fimiseda]
MLRSSSSRNYVCWRCLSQQTKPSDRLLSQLRRTPLQSYPSSSSSSSSSLSSLPIRSHSTVTLFREQTIRNELAQWERENTKVISPAAFGDGVQGNVTNSVTRASADASFQIELPDDSDSTSASIFNSFDDVDLGLAGAVLQAGDLVQIDAATSRLQILAVCLGNFNGHSHYYTSTGKWFISQSFYPGFVVKKFIKDPSELRTIVDAILAQSTSEVVPDELQDLNLGPTRDTGSSLLYQLHKFHIDSRLIRQTYVERLSQPDKRLSPEEKVMSLREIADALLPVNLKRGKKTFPPEVLYAVYTTIKADEVTFNRLIRARRHHESHLFAVNSLKTQRNIIEVEDLLRTFYEFLGNNSSKISRNSATKAMQFRDFILQARKAIDQSRTSRVWSPHGTISPCKKELDPSTLEPIEWSDSGLAVIEFMQQWAAVAAFGPISRYHWVGASVLRAIGRYAGVQLDRTTGWTFLQEIGWVSPWDIPWRYSMRLPGVEVNRYSGLNLPEPKAEADTAPAELAEDQLAHLRQEFARETVYCIDSESTLDVDDGVSLEATPDGKHWIHVHVADPASRIRPDSPMAEAAALKAQSQYLAGFNSTMFKDKIVRETFSLSANQPTLTFSGLVTEDGQIVDYKITPGILRDVVCITPEDVNSICGVPFDHSHLQSAVLEVGTPPEPTKPPPRIMVKPSELSATHIADLKMLSKLADALHQNRLAKGAVPYFVPKPVAKVSLDNVNAIQVGGDSIRCNGDPFIQVAYELNISELVSRLMLVAGEVAARWCSERNIPIPYRVQLTDPKNQAALDAFNRDVLYPQLAAGKKPSPADLTTYRNLIGGFDMATTPGPVPMMGLDCYAKVTSPLRRFPDLIAHWQIEAAILEEHKSGESLVGQKALPPSLHFSKEDLEERVLPMLRVRERYFKSLDNQEGNRSWILQAMLRAWKFGENKESIPKTFRFHVTKIVPKVFVSGEIDWFGLRAQMTVDDVQDGGMRFADFEEGMTVEVEISDIHLFDAMIDVKPLRIIQ